MEPISNEQYNQRINQWVSLTRGKLKQSIATLSMKGKGQLVLSLQGTTKKDFGQIESIVFNFNRYGVFFHKGVGRGYVMSGGKVIRGYSLDSKVIRKGRGNKNVMSVSGEVKREPKEWFNPTLDREVPRLADMVTEMRADMALDAAIIKIR